MLGFGWLTLRQADDALQNGRLEEAYQFLRRPEAQGHRGSAALLRQLAQGYVDRGEQHLQHDDLPAAWKDLQEAEKIGVTGPAADRLRQALVRQGLQEARKLLEAGEPTRAAEALSRVAPGGSRQAEVQLLEAMARGWAQARELAARGELALALETMDRVRQLGSPPAALERFRNELDERKPRFAALVVQLHEAWGEERWREVLRVAEHILAVAPQHPEARKARSRAWKALEPADGATAKASAPADPERRFLLWVDGAGGYLVCLGARVTLGQAVPDAFPDVPLLADVSRTHAALTRDPEGYVIEAVRPVQVNGQSVQKTLLQPGDTVTLGATCRIQFTQPVPASATARLDLVSGQRLPLAVDGVLLMADTLVLGPGPQAHVTVPDLAKPVILFRHKDGLGVRYGGTLIVDGQQCRERGQLGPSSRVRGDDFAFAVEPVGARLGKT